MFDAAASVHRKRGRGTCVLSGGGGVSLEEKCRKEVLEGGGKGGGKRWDTKNHAQRGLSAKTGVQPGKEAVSCFHGEKGVSLEIPFQQKGGKIKRLRGEVCLLRSVKLSI